ncbi:SH3 domain-containing protein [Luteolibacter arcticus]|uniref:SH3 domain-containing protein n=1 Tax=Luteolibacter arcticus TaxID=1581411 RepID=A0ABT3GIB3_9BACT|nr:SH3 domain-containing protein [Luteolibacter arcticus]MCW1923237.1 SH3 domain-containing protein [Luteolibacter arcticus]
MNRHFLTLAPLALVMASCETGNVISSGNFDPLTPPGSTRTPTAASRGLKPGSYVRASMEAAFFKGRPSGSSTAEKMLPANTEMKIISDDGSYAKVELASGEVGYVPSVLVADQAAAQSQVSPDAIQVYPPAPGSLPPLVDPGTPTIPPVIDPDAEMVVPDAPPIPETEPVVPPSEPAPLPPGNESPSEPQVEQ